MIHPDFLSFSFKMKSFVIAILWLFTILVADMALASDMSIITYDQTHGGLRTDKEVRDIYESWLVSERKVYNSLGEKEKRFEIFKNNLKFIDDHNSVKRSYTVGLNQFADLTNEEFKSTYLRGGGGARSFDDAWKGLSGPYEITDGRYDPLPGDVLPPSVDWRQRQAVGRVKNQGQRCLSCWAFSAIAAVEGINKIVTGQFIPLSEQDLVNCDRDLNNGCSLGAANYAFIYILRSGGIGSEANNNYTGIDSAACNRTRTNVVSLDGWGTVPRFDERALQKAVASQPVSVSIDSTSQDFRFYTGGIFTGTCGNVINHDVTVVGYGTSEEGMEYWILKNSYGPTWGGSGEGYMKLQRNAGPPEGKCGIANIPTYPVKNSVQSPAPRYGSTVLLSLLVLFVYLFVSN